jgi:hypothetical protein
LSQLSKIGSSYRSSIKRLKGCCTHVDTLMSKGKITSTECELIYESVFLTSIARFEGLLNDVMEEFVCGVPSTKAGCYVMIRPRTRSAFRVVLTGGRPYIDLMPYKECVDIAKRFFHEGKPFSDIHESDRSILAQAMFIRNAIAHRSASAIKKFRKDVSGVDQLPPHRQFPGSYLRRNYRANPTQTWNTLYLDTFDKVSTILTSSW